MRIIKKAYSNELTDEQLLGLYKKDNEQDILAKLFLKYSDLAYGTCVKYLENQDAAKDAVMDIYGTLVVKVNNQNIDNFKSWLYVVSKNHCLMQLRKNKKLILTDLDRQVMQSPDFSHLDNVLEKERQLDKLGYCIEKLNDDQKQTIRLFYMEQKCYNEITIITGYDNNKVRSLVQNGRRNLKICMDRND